MTMTDLAALLQTTEDNAPRRARAMKLTPPCGRCGGSGRYSFNQIDGDRCYGCNGTGHRAMGNRKRDLQNVIAAAEKAVATGALARYLEEIAAAKMLRNAERSIFEAWKDTRAARENPSHMRRDDELSPRELAARRANAEMARAFDYWSAAARSASTAIERLAALNETLCRIADADIPEEN